MSLETFEVITEFTHSGSWIFAEFSPNMKYLAIGGTKDLLTIYKFLPNKTLSLIDSV